MLEPGPLLWLVVMRAVCPVKGAAAPALPAFASFIAEPGIFNRGTLFIPVMVFRAIALAEVTLRVVLKGFEETF